MSVELETFKQILKHEAERLIKTTIPQKILILNKLIETSIQNQDLTLVRQEVNIPMPDVDTEILAANSNRIRSHRGSRHSRTATTSRHVNRLHSPLASLDFKETVPSNKPLTDLIHLVKPHVKGLLEDTNTLKMWVNYMRPRFEDGNNFGVAIQEMVLTKIDLVEKFAYLLFNYTPMCFMARAEIVSKIATFPQINDYRRAVKECDENNYRYLCKMLCQIRDFYCSLHDVVAKNLDKIQNPRASEINAMCI